MGPAATSPQACRRLAAYPELLFRPPSAPMADFYRFLDAPRAIKKSLIFQPLPKSAPDLKKSTLGHPRLHFSWIFIDFGDNFGVIFQCFCKTPKPSNLLYRAANFKVFSIFVHPFLHQFCIIFSCFFLEPFLDRLFRDFSRSFWKNNDFGCPVAT